MTSIGILGFVVFDPHLPPGEPTYYINASAINMQGSVSQALNNSIRKDLLTNVALDPILIHVQEVSTGRYGIVYM